MPARESLRMAAYSSTLDIRGIGGPPSRPADAPTTADGAETRGHRIHSIGVQAAVALELTNKREVKP
jgi:hypothetical protein